MTWLLAALTCLSLPLVIGALYQPVEKEGEGREESGSYVWFLYSVCWNLSPPPPLQDLGREKGPWAPRGKGQNLRPGSWTVFHWLAQSHSCRAGDRWGQVPRSRRRQTSLPGAGALVPPGALPSPALTPARGPPHRSCSGGNFLSLQLSEASPCPLLVSILSVAHGLGAPVRGPAISHRLASLLP